MRTFAIASILLGTFVLGTGTAGAAPWCTEYGGSGRGGSNCGFYSFEQCMANAWGNGGFCRRNAFEDPLLDRPHDIQTLSPRRLE